MAVTLNFSLSRQPYPNSAFINRNETEYSGETQSNPRTLFCDGNKFYPCPADIHICRRPARRTDGTCTHCGPF